jgi:pimeloyl-ACP methyl ester carboxylesterase
MRRVFLAAAILVLPACVPPEWGANAILHPHRRTDVGRPDIPHRPVVFDSGGVRLVGWLFPAASPRKGLIVYLHGIADNRRSGIGFAQRFTAQGYDVLAYDGRAHGESGGAFCTYGFHERHDVSRALDSLGVAEAVLFGSSLGGAVALQAAAGDTRVRGVIAQSAFADLREIVEERARGFGILFRSSDVAEAIRLAERKAAFRADEVSPRALGPRIHVPVLLLHGEKDRETSPAHARRIYDALAGPRRLVMVAGAGHNDVFGRPETWREVETWLASMPAPLTSGSAVPGAR